MVFTGSLRIRNSIGCVPLTVKTSSGIEGVQNVRYQYEFNDGPLKLSELTTDSSYTYKKPGLYRILQLSEKDGRQMRACGYVEVYDTIAPAFILTTCRNQVSLSVPNGEKYKFDWYIVRWGDGRTDSLAAPPGPVSHTFASNQSYTIRVEGRYRYAASCRPTASQQFRPAVGTASASIASVRKRDEQTLEVVVRNPGAGRLRLERRVSGGDFSLLPGIVAEENVVIAVSANPADTTCFRLALADTCVQAAPSPEVCYLPPPPAVTRSGPYVPDAFSPNGDGQNDEFRIYGAPAGPFLLVIYDRWGRVVFRTEDVGQGWNGQIDGQPAQPGEYAYLFVLESSGNQRFERRGRVLLLR